MAKQIISFKFSQPMADALSELVREDRLVQLNRAGSKTAWLEETLAYFLQQGMKGKVHKGQLGRCKKPDEIFQLFVDYSKAMRKEGFKMMPGNWIMPCD